MKAKTSDIETKGFGKINQKGEIFRESHFSVFHEVNNNYILCTWL